MQESNLFATFQKQFHDNKLGHAFLLETNQFDESLKKVLEIVKLINCPNNYCCNCQDCNLCHLIETRQLPSLIFIEPDNQTIKKGTDNQFKKAV